MDHRQTGPLMLLCLAMSVTQAAAQSVDAEQLLRCAAEADAATRLACYDREVAKASTDSPAQLAAAPPESAERPPAVAPPSGTAQPPSKTASSPDQSTPVLDGFGVQGSELARKRVEEQRRGQPEIKSIEGIVTAVELQPRGELLIDLNNGQTWRQKRPESYFPMKVGDQVIIIAGSLGSFRMTVKSSGRGTQVTRVK